MVCSSQNQHGEAAHRKPSSVERKTQLMEIKKEVTHAAGIHKPTLIERAITDCAIHNTAGDTAAVLTTAGRPAQSASHSEYYGKHS